MRIRPYQTGYDKKIAQTERAERKGTLNEGNFSLYIHD